jgi:hypothetical protein
MKIKHKILVDSGKFEIIEKSAYSNLRYLCWASIIYNWLTVRQENAIDAIMFSIYNKKSGTFEDVEAWMLNMRRRKCFGICVNSKKIENDGSSTSSASIITGKIR